ncbi:MAG TPA: sigma-70 family RNA polymerase sigma factor [Methylomirabilota bacterium]|nr:sigma-70 family RNA polymerase sigma factor [Methylomirabilota bacterium]
MNPEPVPTGSGVFATTHWSVVAAAQRRGTAEAEAALEKLCVTYWRPVFAFVRRCSPDEHVAKDLTQGFFERFLEKEYFRDADPLRGRFRSFLLACTKHFLANQRDKERALRRGGGAIPLSIDQLIQASGVELESNPALTPDRSYERQWAHSVLDNVRSKLRSEFAGSQRADVFDALHVYLSGERDEAPYHVAAEQLRMSVDAVKKNVERMRRRFGKLLREEIAQTVLHPSEIEDELRFLRAALQS